MEGTGLAPLTRYPLEADLRYIVSLGSTFIGIANLGTSRPGLARDWEEAF